MKHVVWVLLLVAGIFALAAKLPAEPVMIPAGTLLTCVLDEPNLSPSTAREDDPVLCQIPFMEEFQQPLFPRGAYLAGRVAGYKKPGRLVGKGWLDLQFDRLVLSDGMVPLDARVVSTEGYRVNKRGRILGRGHAKRDVIEWMFPPLWPVKLLLLPARGPEPTLQSETRMRLLLLQDISVPANFGQASAAPPPRKGSQSESAEPSYLIPRAYYASPSTRALNSTGGSGIPDPLDPLLHPYPPPPAVVVPPDSILLALQNGAVYAARNLWLGYGWIHGTLPDGRQVEEASSQVNWPKTATLNSQRGVPVVIHFGPPQRR